MISKERLAFNAFWWEHLYDEASTRKVVDTLAGLGYKGVEWKETSFNRDAKIADELKRTVRVSKEGGLTVTNAVILRGYSDPATAPKNTEETIAFIRGCAEAGIDKVNIVPGGPAPAKPVNEDWWAPSYSPAQPAWDSLGKSLEAILKVCEETKVYIVIESVVGQLFNDYYSTLQMYKMIDSPYLCLTMDPSHYQLKGNDIPWTIRQWGASKIKHVHLKDAVGIPGAFLFPILGEGNVDWNGFFQALDDIQYNGWLSVEYESWIYMADILKNDIPKAAKISYQSASTLIDNYLTKK